jgi:hypothetical protein
MGWWIFQPPIKQKSIGKKKKKALLAPFSIWQVLKKKKNKGLECSQTRGGESRFVKALDWDCKKSIYII